ncbi:hypothetical protein WN944_007790 [Citrus x changshan-huyou]|uniref:Uncharacterized protein n=1 Tax=Citrus x changshan-huyou TaxID=2935761 RepID=A0AAP0MP11_9ROSI
MRLDEDGLMIGDVWCSSADKKISFGLGDIFARGLRVEVIGMTVTTVKSQQNTNWSTTTALNWNWKQSSRPLRSVSNVSCQILIQRRSLEASISGFIQLSNSRILSPVIHMNTIKALTPQHSSS